MAPEIKQTRQPEILSASLWDQNQEPLSKADAWMNEWMVSISLFASVGVTFEASKCGFQVKMAQALDASLNRNL